MMLTDTLKLADINDIPKIATLCRQFFDESPFAGYTYSEKKVLGHLQAAVLDKLNHTMLVSVDEDKVVGVIVGQKVVPVFSTDPVAMEVCWFLEPKYRESRRGLELLEGYIQWAQLVGCKHIQTALLVNEKHDVDKLMRLHGFKHTEQGFQRTF